MDSLLTSLPNLKLRQKVRDDDTVDQLNHFVTVVLLAFAGFLVSLKEFVGEPLDCWVTVVKRNHHHVNNYCWAHRRMYTYDNLTDVDKNPFLTRPDQNAVNGNWRPDPKDVKEINVYIWATLVLFGQALMFKIPDLVWTLFNSGTKLEKMVTIATESTFKEGAEREKVFSSLANFFETWLKVKQGSVRATINNTGTRAQRCWRTLVLYLTGKTPDYLSILYIVVKFLFLLNFIAQFLVVSHFLNFGFWTYGPDSLLDTIHRRPSRHFPRIGLCQFKIQARNKELVQCNISVNMVLEKIFLLQWFWFVAIFVITLVNTIVWIVRTCRAYESERFVRRYLRLLDDSEKLDETQINDFISDYLFKDGVFVLRILATNTNDVVMAQLVSCIWTRYLIANKLTKSRDSIDEGSLNNGMRSVSGFGGSMIL